MKSLLLRIFNTRNIIQLNKLLSHCAPLSDQALTRNARSENAALRIS